MNIERDVAGNLAERGLVGSSGIFQDVLASALAPYYQQSQDTARSAYLQGLGIPQNVSFPSPQNPQSANYFGAFADALKKALAPDAGLVDTGGGGAISTGEDFTPDIMTLGTYGDMPAAATIPAAMAQ